MQSEKSIWESKVSSQLKTDNIYEQLVSENIENLSRKPIYTATDSEPAKVDRLFENCVLVTDFQSNTHEDVYGFVVNDFTQPKKDVTYFVPSSRTVHIQEKLNAQFLLLNDCEDGSIAYSGKLTDFTCSVNISLWQNAGASIVQQAGIALLQIAEILENTEDSEVGVVLRNAAGQDYFFEIAKIRAMRLGVQQLEKDTGKKCNLYIFTETSRKNKSLADTENNLIRSSLELSAAMTGGSDAVYSAAFDLSDTDYAEEISFKQSILLAYESLINVFEDPARGCYSVESLTREIAEKSWEYFIHCRKQNTYSELLKNGLLYSTLTAHAEKELEWVAAKKIKLTGVNMYPEKEIQKSPKEILSEKSNPLQPHRWSEMYGA